MQIHASTVTSILIGIGIETEDRNAEVKTVLELAKASGDNELMDWFRTLVYRIPCEDIKFRHSNLCRGGREAQSAKPLPGY